MPGNSFILFGVGDVPVGESVQKARLGKNGWIEITDWNWDIEADHSNLTGTGASVGKPKPGQLSFTHPFDTSSPAILSKIVMGKSFPKVYIDMLKQTGEGEPQQFFQISMTNVFISKVTTKGSEDGSVTQDVELVFKAVSIGYKAQGQDNTLGTMLQSNWDIATMTTDEASAPLKFT
jgi:type VI secretion system secreted protein Hcp